MRIQANVIDKLLKVRVKCLWENIYRTFGVEVVRLQHQK